MFGNSLTLFSVRGIEVRIDLSWIIIFALIVWSLAAGVFPETYPGLSRRMYLAMSVAGALALFLSIVLHELAHAIVAARYGLRVRSITLFLFGGVADLQEEPPSPKAEMSMALAGPAASLALAGGLFAVSIAAWVAGLETPWWSVVAYLGAMNLLLFIFNMIPAFPLDGGRVLRAWLWGRSGDLRKATRSASRSGSLFGILMMALGAFFMISGNLIGGLWWILIGFFIRGAAQLAYHQIFIRSTLEGEPVRAFMKADPVTVPRSVSIRDLVDEFIFRHHYKLYPVMDDGRLVGCVTTAMVRQVPKEEWERQTVGSIAEDCSPQNTIDPDADALDALALMSRHKRSRLVVSRGETLIGIITLKDLMSFLSVKMELEGKGGGGGSE